MAPYINKYGSAHLVPTDPCFRCGGSGGPFVLPKKNIIWKYGVHDRLE